MNNKLEHLPSLQRELIRTLTLVSLGWMLALFLTLTWGVRHEVDDLMDDTLREAGEVIYGLVALRPNLPDEALGELLPAPPHVERVVWQILEADGSLVRRSHGAPRPPLLPAFHAGLSDGSGGWRVYGMRLLDRNRILYVAQHGAERFESRYESVVFVGLSAMAVSVVFAVLLRRRVAAALHPLRGLAAQIEHYDPLRPDTQLPEATRAEFAVVRASITALGERLARKVQQEQAFAAHAAHALRTPLAGMDAQLALALREVDESARPRLQRTRAAVDRLKRVVTSLLALFRSGHELALQPLTLADLTRQLPVEDLSLHLEGGPPLRADPDLISAALANLLDNAVRHGATDVWLSTRREGQVQCLCVRDNGPGVDEGRRADLQAGLDDTSERAGSGLGLRLVDLIARAHAGSLTLEPGPGFAVSLRLWERAGADGQPMQG